LHLYTSKSVDLELLVVAGLGLDTHEFASAVKEIRFTLFLQGFNFGFVSLVVWASTRVLVNEMWLDRHFADGMVICSCLPMAINMVFILTKTAGGDEAAAILNSSLANLIGIFISPLLILKYLGVTTAAAAAAAAATAANATEEVGIVQTENVINLRQVFSDLALRIILPLLMGQWMQRTLPRLVCWIKKDYATWVKKSQIYALVFIVYTVFCTTFAHGYHFAMTSFLLVVMYQLVLLCFMMLVSWYTLPFVVPDHKPSLRVMGFFGCTFKTVSVGVPLIQAMYSGQPQAGLYTLPVLIWHPLQLIVGSILAPYLRNYVTATEEILQKAVYEPEVSLQDLIQPNEESPLLSISSPEGSEYV
jgi:solute carrier family 10 (sodium/bile acid cotransporter), member 7